MNQVSNPIETYRNVGIAIESTGDQNYYCILDNRVVKSQLIEQLHSEIDKHFDVPSRIVRTYGVEYMRRGSDNVYFTTLSIEVAEDLDTLTKNAEQSLRDNGIKFTRIISVR